MIKRFVKKSVLLASLFLFVLLLVNFVWGDVIINEIMYNPLGTDSYTEWIELYNNGTSNIDITGWKLCGVPLLKGYINHTDGDLYLNTSMILNTSKYALITDGYSGASNAGTDVYDNLSVSLDALALHVNRTYMCKSTGLSNTGQVINITNSTETYIYSVNYNNSWGGDGNGKTLIWYNNNWTESALENGTPGASNDQFAPDFNKWVSPAENNSIISGLFNITVNITDVTNVSSVLVNFNNTNYPMTNNGLWYYEWDTTKNTDGKYNITIYYNDTEGNSDYTILYDATIDNSPPKVQSFNGDVVNNTNLSGTKTINVTITDATLTVNYVYFNITNSSGNILNLTAVKTADNTSWVNTSFITTNYADGSYNITVFANDTLNNINNSESITIVIDNTAPAIANETKTPEPSYNNNSVQLNATINDAHLDSVWISGTWHNGSWINYSGVTNVGNVYSYTVGAGNFSNQETVQWKYYANDTLGNLANGSLQSFTVANREPIVTIIPAIAWPEDTSNTSNLSQYFSDPDGDNLTYSYINAPVNITVSVNATTGIVNLTPKGNFTGIEYINFTATDNINTTTSNGVVLNVTPVNDPPIITSTPTLTAIEAIKYIYDVNATDIDSNVSQLVYGVENPSNAVINSSTGLLGWTPTATQVGVNEFIVNVTDPEGNYTTQSFNVTVTPVLDITDMEVNSISVSDNDTIENIKPGDTITVNYKIRNRFSDGIKGDLVGITSTRRIDELGYSSTTSAFNLDAQETKELSYTFSVPYIIGVDNFKLNLSVAGQDLNITPNHYSSEKNINFNINKSLHNITITKKEFSNSNLTCDRKTELIINVTNTGQAEENVTVIVTNTDINKSKNFKLASNTDTILNYTIDTTSSTTGKKTFTITVSYQFGYFSFTETIDLLVNDCLDIAALNNILKVNEDASPGWSPLDLTNYTFGNTAGLIYGIISQNSSLINCSVINNNTLSCSTPSANNSGISTINMSINASSSIYETFNIVVEAVNDPPTINKTLPTNVIFNEDFYNDSFDLDDYAYDIDNLSTELRWSYTGNASNLNISINPSTHVLSISADPNWYGNRTVTFYVTDNEYNATDGSTIIIVKKLYDDTPNITAYYPIYNPKIAEDIGTEQKFNITISDPDEINPIIKWYLNNIENGTGNSYSYISNGTAGDYTIKVNITNSTDSKTWTLTVSETPLSSLYTGTILSQTNLTNAVNVTIVHPTYGLIDFGNNTIDLSDVVDLDHYINISSGVVGIDTTIFPALNRSATITMNGLSYAVTPFIYYNSGFSLTGNTICPSTICSNISYSSSTGVLTFNAAHFSIYWTGANTSNQPPVITSSPKTTAIQFREYSYDVDATDIDNDTITYSLRTYPSGMSISSSSGLITWTPNATGIYNTTVVATDNNYNTTQIFDITVSKGSPLLISKVDVKVDGKSDKDLDDGDTISKEAKPGSDVEFKIEVENLYTDEDDLEIEDITVTVTIEDIDDGDDLEEESSEFNLKPEKDKKITLDFKIPLEVDEDIYTVEIRAEGEDENNTEFETTFTVYLEVEKKSHEIRVKRAYLSPSQISCQRTTRLETTIINTGSSDEDDVSLRIENAALKINKLAEGIELDEGTDDNTYEAAYTLDIAEDVSAGTYPISIKTYYDSKSSGYDTVELTVKDCIVEIEIEKEQKVTVKTTEGEIITNITKEPVEKPVTEITFRESNSYLMLLILLYIMVTATGVFMFVYLIKIKK